MSRYFYPNPRNTTVQMKKVELSWLRKHNYLNGLKYGNISWSCDGTQTGDINILVNTYSENPYARFTYKTRPWGSEQWKDIEFEISMEHSSCRFGGKKWFFICGFRGCVNRARILYFLGDYFMCRKCANLSYESCNASQSRRRGYLKVLLQSWRADEYYSDNVKRKIYNGRLTKKYQRYLRMDSTQKDQISALKELDTLLTVTNK